MSDAPELSTRTDTPDVGELTPPDRTLMGPGPSDVHPRVLKAIIRLSMRLTALMLLIHLL